MSTLHDLDMSHEPAPYTTPPPVASPVAPEAGAALVLTPEHRARIKHLAEIAEGEDPSGPWAGVASDALYAELPTCIVLGTLAYVEHLEAEAAALRTQLAEAEEARKAEGRAYRQELAEQEVAKLKLIQETHRWSEAEKRDKVRHEEELGAMRQKWIAATAQAQRFALRLGLWSEAGIQEKGGAGA